MNPATYLSGILVRGTLCSTVGSEKPPIVLLKKGVVTPPPPTMSEMLRDFGADSWSLAKRCRPGGNAAVMVLTRGRNDRMVYRSVWARIQPSRPSGSRNSSSVRNRSAVGNTPLITSRKTGNTIDWRDRGHGNHCTEDPDRGRSNPLLPQGMSGLRGAVLAAWKGGYEQGRQTGGMIGEPGINSARDLRDMSTCSGQPKITIHRGLPEALPSEKKEGDLPAI
jgi:hypothetical protein